MQTDTPQAATTRLEVCALSAARRVAAMLDRDPDALREGDLLPRGWQFILMGADTPRKALRADGFPGLGVPIPDLGLPRLMLAGRTVHFLRDIPIGAAIERTSRVERIVEKGDAASGRMALVTIGHQLAMDGQPVLAETQTYALLGESRPRSAKNAQPEAATAAPGASQVLTPDETLLFQYSALGFNSHKIHWDKRYTQEVEGLPDLVVNGGLITLLMTEFVASALKATPVRLQVKHLAPLYCGRPATLAGSVSEAGLAVQALNEQGQLCAKMEVETQ